MYNLSVDEISMVNGGGDGGNIGDFIKTGVKGLIAEEIIGAGLGFVNDALGWNNDYSNNSGVGIGTNQNYGGYGLNSCS